MTSIVSRLETDFRNAPANQAANIELSSNDGLFHGVTLFSGVLTNQTGPNKGKLNGELAEAMFKPYNVNAGLNSISIDSDADSGLSPIHVLLSGQSQIKQATTPAGALPVMAVTEDRDYMRSFFGLPATDKDTVPVAFQLKTTTNTLVQASKNDDGETLTQYQLMAGDTPGTFVRQLFSKNGQHIFRVKYDAKQQPEAFQLVNNTQPRDKQSGWLPLTDLDNGSVAPALAIFKKATGDDVASLKKIFELDPARQNATTVKTKAPEANPTSSGSRAEAPRSSVEETPTVGANVNATSTDADPSDQDVQDFMDANPVGADGDFEAAKAKLKALLKAERESEPDAVPEAPTE
jgi:hypothetical protein